MFCGIGITIDNPESISITVMPNLPQRCPWCTADPLYQQYHDQVWGRPVADERELFAKLCLDGQQAGLSWLTILKKQPTYYQAYAQFDPEVLVTFDANAQAQLLHNPGIVRNRLKIASIIQNAQGFLRLKHSGHSFAEFVWQFVEGRPCINHYRHMDQVPTTTAASDALSKALKKQGFTFVGSTICYAFMQAVGMVNDHLLECPSHSECTAQAQTFTLKPHTGTAL